MKNNEILDYIKTEFAPIQLATPDTTIEQLISNAKRYWNTHSAFPLVKMFPYSGSTSSGALQLTPDYKNVTTIYPATTPDWIMGNYPLWTLLGITVIDNLTSDLILLSEAYRNYRYYIGTDFYFNYQKSDNPTVGGKVYLTNLPTGSSNLCVVGTKRIIEGSIAIAISGTSGILDYFPLEANHVSITNGTQIYTDDGDGILVSSILGYEGTIDYTTGNWDVTGWDNSVTTGIATYNYIEEIKSEYILEWLLGYIKTLVKLTEGNALRKMSAIGVSNDGQTLFGEGKEEKKELEERLGVEGRWVAFSKRF